MNQQQSSSSTAAATATGAMFTIAEIKKQLFAPKAERNSAAPTAAAPIDTGAERGVPEISKTFEPKPTPSAASTTAPEPESETEPTLAPAPDALVATEELTTVDSTVDNGAELSALEIANDYEPTPTPTLASTPAPVPVAEPASTGMPTFEDAAIIASVALFHLMVCAGFWLLRAAKFVGAMTPYLCAVVALATACLIAIALLLCGLAALAIVCGAAASRLAFLAALRAAAAVCALGRFLQPAVKPRGPTRKDSVVRPTAARGNYRPKEDETQREENDQDFHAVLAMTPIDAEKVFQEPSRKVSPALRTTKIPGTWTCKLVWSSHNVSKEQTAQTQRVRDILRDNHVVVEELDAATWAQEHVQHLRKATDAPHGVYPQVFLASTQVLDVLNEQTQTFEKKIQVWTRHIAMDVLDAADYYGLPSLQALVRERVVSKSALYLFRDVATRASYKHTFYGQLEQSFKNCVVMEDTLEELHEPWHVAVDMSWAKHNFEDVWDIYTAYSLYYFLP